MVLYLYLIFQFCILYYIFLNLVPFCFKLFLIGPKSLFGHITHWKCWCCMMWIVPCGHFSVSYVMEQFATSASTHTLNHHGVAPRTLCITIHLCRTTLNSFTQCHCFACHETQLCIAYMWPQSLPTFATGLLSPIALVEGLWLEGVEAVLQLSRMPITGRKVNPYTFPPLFVSY